MSDELTDGVEKMKREKCSECEKAELWDNQRLYFASNKDIERKILNSLWDRNKCPICGKKP